jgi:hypothetical protein
MTRSAGRCLVLLLALASPVAWAQVYKWVDENGRVHYGEKPPPGAKSSAVKPPIAAPGSSARSPDVQSQELDFRDRQMKRNADEARQAQDAANRAAICSNAKERLELAERAALFRMEKGERVFLSDAEQKAETENRRAAVTRYCS